jgi:hypothetical protein
MGLDQGHGNSPQHVLIEIYVGVAAKRTTKFACAYCRALLMQKDDLHIFGAGNFLSDRNRSQAGMASLVLLDKLS